MPTVHARALKRAIEILGGIDEFSRHAKVSAYDLALWIRGDGVPPMDAFLVAVDVICEHDKAALNRQREGEPPVV